MTVNQLDLSKKRLSSAFHKLEQLIEQKLQNNDNQTKVAIAETHRLERHLKTITNRYISLQTVTKETVGNCNLMISEIENLIK